MATSKRWASLAIVDARGAPAPCELLLVGKDAVYLMQVRCLTSCRRAPVCLQCAALSTERESGSGRAWASWL